MKRFLFSSILAIAVAGCQCPDKQEDVKMLENKNLFIISFLIF